MLSKNGLVRAAKGHDIDPYSLSYKSSDSYQDSAIGRSNGLATFLDSTGRTYTIQSHDLPSARGLGEPLSAKLNPPAGAHFVGVVCKENSNQFLLSSNYGYGFICDFESATSRSKAGKVTLNVPSGSLALPPVSITKIKDTFIAAITSSGYMLVVSAADLPQLTKGKGNKIINIPSKQLKEEGEKSPFLEGSIGAAKIRTTFSEDEWLEMEKIAKTGLGWFGEKGMWTPIFRTLKSSSLTAKEAIGKLLENPLYQVKNFKNVASEQSIERNI